MEAVRVPHDLAYRTVRQHVTELLLSSPDTAATASAVVPSCPEWTVSDLVVHLAGNCAGMLGEVVGPGEADLAGQLARWNASAIRVERLAADGAVNISRLLMDAFTHELDLRAVLGVATPVDHPAYPLAFDVVIGGLAASIRAWDLPALRLVGESASWVAGPRLPVATVRAPRYDLYRSLTGRRTAAQIAKLQWSADPGPWLPAFFWGPFRPPVQPVLPGQHQHQR
jgi:uncharacterized protein (TIGR03083 family)